jgi:hypothetical protein
MFPLAHAAFGYLVYALLGHSPDPDRSVLAALALGTQFPDLVDKPLANRRLLSSGRSLTHALPVALPLLAGLRRLTDRRAGSDLATAFVVGYLTHLAGDFLEPLARREWETLRPLGWPLLAVSRADADDIPPLARIRESYRPPPPWTDLLLTGTALLIWARARFAGSE